ncbi:MBL fold metallo-hydrolase [Cupriavidus necator]|uniref:MBL fold metallo-hydrolase n=1 Tax=Cupriavidus necator TaxID=106590 RepID=UPI00339D3F97
MFARSAMSLRALMLGALVVTSSIAVVTPRSAYAAAPQVRTQAPGYYRMMLGHYEITALSDGTAKVPLDHLLAGISPAEIQRLLARNFEMPKAETSINAFLVNTGTKLLLVDTGAGNDFGPGIAGALQANIQAAGYRAEDIDAVLLTHIHLDHSGGLTVDGKAMFPNAVIYVNQEEAEFWFNPANRSKVPAGQRDAFARADASFAPYRTAGKIRTFAGGTELFPGVRAITMSGHTHGHTFYQVESRGKRMQFWGDTIHAQSVQFSRPEVTIDFDVDQAAAARQRKKAFADAAAKGYWVAAAHISFPGLGHIRRDGKAYSWVPANYSSGQ